MVKMITQHLYMNQFFRVVVIMIFAEIMIKSKYCAIHKDFLIRAKTSFRLDMGSPDDKIENEVFSFINLRLFVGLAKMDFVARDKMRMKCLTWRCIFTAPLQLILVHLCPVLAKAIRRAADS